MKGCSKTSNGWPGAAAAGGRLMAIAPRAVPALILIGAAVLKLATRQPMSSLQVWAVAEMAVGLWLLSAGMDRIRGMAAALLFAAFLTYNLWQWAAGAGSCGCFGVLELHPAITVCIDLAGLACAVQRVRMADQAATIWARHIPSLVGAVALALLVSTGVRQMVVPRIDAVLAHSKGFPAGQWTARLPVEEGAR